MFCGFWLLWVLWAATGADLRHVSKQGEACRGHGAARSSVGLGPARALVGGSEGEARSTWAHGRKAHIGAQHPRAAAKVGRGRRSASDSRSPTLSQFRMACFQSPILLVAAARFRQDRRLASRAAPRAASEKPLS